MKLHDVSSVEFIFDSVVVGREHTLDGWETALKQIAKWKILAQQG